MNHYANQYADVANTNVTPMENTTPRPLALSSAVPELPYPVEHLPSVIREAVLEVEQFTQAGLPLLANNALGALATVGQSIAKVKVDANIIQPCSLFLLISLPPNARKSASEAFFTKALDEFEHRQRLALEPEWAKFRTTNAALNAKAKGIQQAIQKQARANESTEAEEQRLLQLEKSKPKQPPFVRIKTADITREALFNNLNTKYPTCVIKSSEAAGFFSGAALADNPTATFALLNDLWSGSKVSSDRKVDGSSTLSDVALSIDLAVQPDVLNHFLQKTQKTARGSGFFARFLFAAPTPQVGLRMYQEPPTKMKAAEHFNHQLTKLLSQLPDRISKDLKLKRQVVELSAGAKMQWVKFNNSVEQRQRPNESLAEIQDIAGKSANICARLACLFHLIENPDNGLEEAIDEKHMIAATHIVEWHLNEARRFFVPQELPLELSDAINHLDFLKESYLSKGINHITLRELQQRARGGREARERGRLLPALSVLVEHHYLLPDNSGRTVKYYLNRHMINELNLSNQNK